ncbi:MAG: hypothetical protein LBT19_01805, partial [Candidatus Nomurabacteria bacterium]|nr:hypothetical protein [Candidatus Nomurabacteria bacterium]
MRKEPITITPLHIGGVIMAVTFIILLVFTLIEIFTPNPYGQGLRIDNLSEYVKNLPDDRKDAIFASLYKAAELNIADGDKVPGSGAMIRTGSAKENYNDAAYIYSGSFIVDIEEISHSYQIQYEWSSEKENPNLSGYQVVITCLPKELAIYDDFVCKDMFSAGDLDPYGVVALHLPHYGKTESGE